MGFTLKGNGAQYTQAVIMTILGQHSLCVYECDSHTCVVAVDVVLLLDPHIC